MVGDIEELRSKSHLNCNYAALAQLVAQETFNLLVLGSSPRGRICEKF